MSDETGLERAEKNFRALVRCRSNGGGLEDFLAEYDRRGEEIDRMRSWAGLIAFLDEQYPADVFGASTDPGPTIIVLTRKLNDMRAERDEVLMGLRELLDDLGKIKPFRVADGYHETATQVDAWFKKFLKLAERTIPGDDQ